MGDAGDDWFIFNVGGGQDIVLDYDADGDDTLHIQRRSGIEDFDDLDISSKKGDAVINLGHGDRIVLRDIDPDDLDATDFDFFD